MLRSALPLWPDWLEPDWLEPDWLEPDWLEPDWLEPDCDCAEPDDWSVELLDWGAAATANAANANVTKTFFTIVSSTQEIDSPI